ncbi:hypothetical protein BH23BAC1_BH23BAC1_51160 [soil metagenome]
MKISEDLKKAIKELPEKEKDKLLIRLIPKNSLLVQQLEYKLLEFSETMLSRRGEVKDSISKNLEKYPDYYYNPGYLLMDMRDMSGMINLHVNITKDKLGEIELNLFMLNEILGRNQTKLKYADYYEMIKFNEYIVKRGIKLLKLVKAIDEDFQVDFQQGFQELGNLIESQSSIFKTARDLGLDINHFKNF